MCAAGQGGCGWAVRAAVPAAAGSGVFGPARHLYYLKRQNMNKYSIGHEKRVTGAAAAGLRAVSPAPARAAGGQTAKNARSGRRGTGPFGSPCGRSVCIFAPCAARYTSCSSPREEAFR